MVGGLVRALVEREARRAGARVEEQREAGIPFSSGLLGGAALLGVTIAVAIYLWGPEDPSRPAAWVVGHAWIGGLAAASGALAFAALAWILYRTARRERVW